MKYEFRNEAEKAELKIYDTIDSWGEVNVQYVNDELQKAGNRPLDIYINSYGGEVFEGFAIYNTLKRYAGYKTVYIDGIAASIASVIALAGDKVIMNKASMFMIHNASGACIGNAEDMKKVVQALEQINEVIKDVYRSKTNLSDEQLTELMDNETFLTANDCLQFGFCDEILDDDQTQEEKEKMTNSLNLLKDSIEQRINVLNSLKGVSQVGEEDSVDDEEKHFNKESHWNWLNRKEVF